MIEFLEKLQTDAIFPYVHIKKGKNHYSLNPFMYDGFSIITNEDNELCSVKMTFIKNKKIKYKIEENEDSVIIQYETID